MCACVSVCSCASLPQSLHRVLPSPALLTASLVLQGPTAAPAARVYDEVRTVPHTLTTLTSYQYEQKAGEVARYLRWLEPKGHILPV